MRLSHPTKKINARIKLPSSKSESNRVLILSALSGDRLQLQNLSSASDTVNLANILAHDETEVNVRDAGTSMRFLTAYYAVANRHKIITGNERMKNRPIGPLVDALSEMGFDVRCKEKEGFPPVEVHPVNTDKVDGEVWVDGKMSSQFVTALLLIAPFLKNGLKIKFISELASKSYIEMTLKILEHFGVMAEWTHNSVLIHNSQFAPQPAERNYSVGGDWSSASYWYSIAFLAEEAEIFLDGLNDEWIQGDREITVWMKRFGVSTEFSSEGALLRKSKVNHPTLMKMNFLNNPDLAQTFIAMFAAKNITCNVSGIDSLKIKETDRIAALQTELKKMSYHFEYAPMYEFYQLKGNFHLPTSPVQTYGDHRMAMSFAPLALLGDIEIEHPEVVQKSYPEFWNDLEKAGFVIS